MGTSSGWFVVLGSVISLASGALTSWLNTRATSNREVQARNHDLRLKIADFQFKTVLELQDAMSEMSQAVLDQSAMIGRDTPPGVGEGVAFGLIANNIKKLISRTHDDQIRSLAWDYHDIAYECVARGQANGEGVAFGDEEYDPDLAAKTLMERISSCLEIHQAADERMGMVLRTMHESIGS